MSFREYLLKLGQSDFPEAELSDIPGTPVKLKYPGEERLPGMMEWASKELISRMGKGLLQGQDPQALVEQEGKKGLLRHLVTGGLAGATGGLLGGRALGGESVTAPFKEIWKQGPTQQALSGLKNIPTSVKALPLVGAGLGLLGGAAKWHKGTGERKRQAGEVVRGLLSEQVTHAADLNKAMATLRKIPIETASTPTPAVVKPGSGAQ